VQRTGPGLRGIDELSIAPLDAAQWSALAARFQDHNYRQSWAFAHVCAERVGAVSEHVRIDRDGELIAVCDVRVRQLAVVGGGIAYVNGGPLVRQRDALEFDALRDALVALRNEYVERRRMILRVAPAVSPAVPTEEVVAVFTDAGFVPAQQPFYRTMFLDLRPPLDSLRRGLAQKWRNGLNGAEKQGLEVESGESRELMQAFVGLFGAFRERKGFDVDLGPDYYARAQEAALPAERFRVTVARRDGEVVAGHVASCLGDTSVYLLGASLPAGLEAKAGYLLQWRAIEEARKRGLVWYDLGGIDPVGNVGVYHFKKGLSGIDVTAPGPFEVVPHNASALLTRFGERIYRSMRAQKGSER
jgi:CelD/BcsL family acetyltransferase involved in cellulose biosynthesis